MVQWLHNVVPVLTATTLGWHWDGVAFALGCFGAFVPYVVTIVRNNGKFDPDNPRMFVLAFLIMVPCAGFFTTQVIQPPDSFSAFYAGLSFPIVISSLFGKG